MPREEWFSPGLRFTCTQCGNCCTGPPGYVWFSPEEGAAIAAHLKVSLDDFHQRYAHTLGGRWSLQERLTERGYDCVFLLRAADGTTGCAVYAARPTQCRTWPFWPENLRRPQDWQHAAAKCPGVAAGMEGVGKSFPVEQVRVIRDRNPAK